MTATGPSPFSPTTAGGADDDVRCPLCDYNLRGLAEPKCPECGYRFTWPEVLDPSLRRHPYLFEHHPRRNAWSFWRTVRGGLRPRRFWSSLKPSQPSHPGRLFLYWVVASAFVLLAAVAPLTLAVVDFRSGQQRARDAWVAQLNSAAFQRTQTGTLTVATINSRYGSVQNYANITFRTDWGFALAQTWRGASVVATPFVFLAAWPWLTVAALMVFRVSMRRARIRPVHVVRCVVYSFDGLFWLGVLSPLLAPVAVALLLLPGDWKALAPGTLTLLYFTAFAFMVYRLTVAYRLYLRFDRPVATVLASQVIVGLFALTAMVNVTLWV